MTVVDERPDLSDDQDVQALFKEARRRRLRRRLGMGASLALLAAAGVAIAAGLGAFVTPPSGPSNAQGHLGLLPTPATALHSDGVGLAMIQVSNVDNVSVDVAATLPIRIDQWVTERRQVVVRTSFRGFRFTSPQAKSSWTSTGLSRTSASTTPVVNRGGVGTLSGTGVLDLSNVPRTSRLLHEALTVRGPRSQLPKALWEPNAFSYRIVELLIAPEVGGTPQLDRALVGLLPSAPGVQPLGTVTTHTGENGRGYELDGVASPSLEPPVVIVSPSSGRVLEVRNWPFSISPLPLAFSATATGGPGHTVSSLTSIAWFDPATTNRVVSSRRVPVRSGPPRT